MFRAKTFVTGIILDEQGEPIVGATISLKDGKTLAISDVNGRFSVNISPGTENQNLVYWFHLTNY